MPSYADLYNPPATNSTPRQAQKQRSQDDGWTIKTTIARIENVVNEDVEMQVPLSEQRTYLVVDTNILLGDIDILQRFVADIERLGAPVLVVIPGIVVTELDNQKARKGLEWHARRASAWLLEKVKERSHVKGQTLNETLKSSGNWKSKSPGEHTGMHNDTLIIDCAQFFLQRHPTCLLSNDKNLCFLSESSGVRSISLGNTSSSSRDIARAIFGDHEALPQFSDDAMIYRSFKQPWSEFSSKRGQSKGREKGSRPYVHSLDVDDDIGMDIDDDSLNGVSLPSHPLDLLHIQVVEHFTRLLCDLCQSMMLPREVNDNRSIHATPEIVRWDARTCIQHLDGKRRRKAASSSPRLETFLGERYSGHGARPGQEWTKGAWIAAMTALEEVGSLWEEVSFNDSVRDLRPHVEGIFSMPLRPTGM